MQRHWNSSTEAPAAKPLADAPWDKQLFLQSSVDVKTFVRDDLMKVLAVQMDYLVLAGAGGAQPLGIMNTTGIGSAPPAAQEASRSMP
jgi:HK97 family phage major capsid protein